MMESSDNLSSRNDIKRIRTPSPVKNLFDEQLEALLTFKSRMKAAVVAPNEFLPTVIFEKFSDLSTNYKAIINSDPFPKNFIINQHTIKNAIEELRKLFIHCFVVTQENNWVFITQVEIYYKDRSVDDVAIVRNLDHYPDKLRINMEKFQEGKGTWYELRFTFKKFEVIATGGFHNNKDNNRMNAFLGVAAPAIIAEDTNFIFFSPVIIADSTACPRMLRNYRKKASLYPWCIKSAMFVDMDFSTPLPLQLHESEPVGYVSICSKLINLSSNGVISSSEMNNLNKMLINIKYWKDLGFEENKTKKVILEMLNQIKKIKNSGSRKPSEGKRLLIELIVSYEEHREINEDSFVALYNGILYQRVKTLRKQKIRQILKN